ncbi:MAG: DUF3047 domain-containing protein [Candidatus Omnitrophica bacterium]|nr:DUF3047 domain-containing protein [Candidatus Omnitrophota bacterium]
MPVTKRSTLALAVIFMVAIAGAVFLFWRFERHAEAPISVTQEKTVPVLVAAWREDFIPAKGDGVGAIPEGWDMHKKPGTRSALFSLNGQSEQPSSFLQMTALKASGSLVTKITEVDIRKAPLLRWRWKATKLPIGADGRIKAKDDQAIGIYIGTGSTLDNKSVSYRWDTETPRGSEGNCVYGMGTIKVKWYTLRNKEDVSDGGWFIEERNAAEDFNEAWGYYPEKLYLSVSCNSQYTGSEAEAGLDWIEFLIVPDDLQVDGENKRAQK